MEISGLLTDDMKRVVREQRLGFVATVCPNGTPNLSPKGTTTVWDDDHLIFADIRSPVTVENLRQNPTIEINVVDHIVRKGYRFKGTGQVLDEGPLFERAAELYRRDFNLDRERINSIVVVRVLEARPLVSPAYDLGLSEDEVRRRWESYYAALRSGEETEALSD